MARAHDSAASPRREKAAALFVVALAMLIGAYVRLSPVLSADLPLNDGGSFTR